MGRHAKLIGLVLFYLMAGMGDGVASSSAEKTADSGRTVLSAKIYQRAEQVLPQNIRDLIRQISVRPNWTRRDGSTFWYERQTASGYEYLLIDPKTRRVRSLFDHERLLKKLSSAVGQPLSRNEFRLRSLEFNAELNTLAFEYAKQRWTYDIGRKELKSAPAFDAPKGVLSPDGAWMAVLRNHDLYVISTETGREIRLTQDGSAERRYARPVLNVKQMIAAGAGDPDLEPEVYWSPDSKKLATYSVDFRSARRLSLVQSTPPDGAQPRVYDYHYTLTGDETPPLARGFIFDVVMGRRIEVSLPPEPMLYYGGLYFEWDATSRAVFHRVPSRGYKSLQLLRVDAASGQVKILTEDRADTYVDYYGHHWSYIPDWGTHFWTADETGYAHVYAIDAETGERRQITSGSWRARSVAGVDKRDGAVLIVGSGREPGRDPYLRTLYRLSRNGLLTLLTPEPLDHDVSVSPDGQYFVDNMSLINVPTRSVLRRASDGKIVMELGKADISAYAAAGYTLPEPFEALAADGTTPIYGAIFKPGHFNPAQRYPVIEDIYTGPHYVMTPKSFEAAMTGRNANAIAQLGFFTVLVDGRGTWGRSRAFQLPAYQNLHDVGLDDHIAGIRAAAQLYPQMDLERVGIYGFSAGGYDVVRALTRRPDFYKVGVSASGNHDNRLDKAQWNEQWMGRELGPVYDVNSNVTWAHKLKGKLFLAHGELDENVPPAATLRLVNALIAANKTFDLLIVPNADHYLDRSPYFQQRRWDFFVRYLLNVEPPADYTIKPFE